MKIAVKIRLAEKLKMARYIITPAHTVQYT